MNRHFTRQNFIQYQIIKYPNILFDKYQIFYNNLEAFK